MMYMTPGDAQARLQERHGIDTTLYIGDVLAASEELRSAGPFIDSVDLTEESAPLPDALLDWVALRANEIRRTAIGPPPASRIKTGDVTVDLELGGADRDLHRLVRPYLKRRGRVA